MVNQKVIITGATGMVGEGVLYCCLKDPSITQILVITRKPTGYSDPKLIEIIHEDFLNLDSIKEKLSGYDACYFCLGVSSVGMSAEKYFHLTYELTMHVADSIAGQNNGTLRFCYVSGVGTDSSEKGRSRWARVKGKTENDLKKLPFKAVFAFRPGFIKPIKGLKYYHKFYDYFNWLFPIGRALSSNSFCTLEELALAMIHISGSDSNSKIVSGLDIIALAKTK